MSIKPKDSKKMQGFQTYYEQRSADKHRSKHKRFYSYGIYGATKKGFLWCADEVLSSNFHRPSTRFATLNAAAAFQGTFYDRKSHDLVHTWFFTMIHLRV